MVLTCVIVDDEPLAVGLLESYVKKTPFLELYGSYSSAVAASEVLCTLDEPVVDLLFLDIQMPELSGITFSKMVNSHTKIVFTTAFSEYAVEGFRVQAFDYLLKPISYADFVTTVNKVVHWFELSSGQKERAIVTQERELDMIYVKSDYKHVQIKLNDILYIEGMKDYLKIVMQGREKPIVSLISMRKMEEELPHDRFLRVHRSFIVQLDKISVLERGHIIFGRIAIPISTSYKERFLELLDKQNIQKNFL